MFLWSVLLGLPTMVIVTWMQHSNIVMLWELDGWIHKKHRKLHIKYGTLPDRMFVHIYVREYWSTHFGGIKQAANKEVNLRDFPEWRLAWLSPASLCVTCQVMVIRHQRLPVVLHDQPNDGLPGRMWQACQQKAGRHGHFVPKINTFKKHHGKKEVMWWLKDWKGWSAKRWDVQIPSLANSLKLQHSYQLSNERWCSESRFNIDSYTFGIEFSGEAATDWLRDVGKIAEFRRG